MAFELQVALGGALSATAGYAARETGDVFGKAYELSRRVALNVEIFPALYGLWNYYLVCGHRVLWPTAWEVKTWPCWVSLLMPRTAWISVSIIIESIRTTGYLEAMVKIPVLLQSRSVPGVIGSGVISIPHLKSAMRHYG